MEQLEYEIVCASSTSSCYTAENIRVDAPGNHTSRWTSDSTVPPQFVLLRVAHGPALVQAVRFGKFDKPHVCNMRKFVVYAGMHSDSLVEVCKAGLRNDNTAETVALRCKTLDEDSVEMPVRYVKIMPTQSWGPAYNYAIWHVALLGVDDRQRMADIVCAYSAKLTSAAARHCLQFCRAAGMADAADALEHKHGVVEMHPRVMQLKAAVLCAAYDLRSAESVMHSAANEQLLSERAGATPYECTWRRLGATVGGAPLGPEPRGGHQMVVDEANDNIYLFGGWNGHSDLSDFWQFDLNTGVWRLLCRDTSAVGGPPPSSCHRMVLDPVGGQLFVLGRYVDANVSDYRPLATGELYAYEIECGRWHVVSEDTDADGGPPLLFDHQMVMDQANRTIYVSGGCIVASAASRRRTSLTEHWACSVLGPSATAATGLAANTASAGGGGGGVSAAAGDKRLQYSGIYKYDIASNTWRLLRRDAGDIGSASSSCHPPVNTRRPASSSSGASLAAAQRGGAFRGRSGHSMLFDPMSRTIYMFAGVRRRSELNDMLVYDVDGDELTELCNEQNQPVLSPAAGHTQRSTFDPDTGEIYVLSGMRQESDNDTSPSDRLIANAFWVFSIANKQWTCVFESDYAAAQRVDREQQQRMQHESRIQSTAAGPSSSAAGGSRSSASQHSSLPRLLADREQHMVSPAALFGAPLSHPNNVPLGSGLQPAVAAGAGGGGGAAVAFAVTRGIATQAAAQAAAAAAYAALVDGASQGLESWRSHSETNSFDARMQLLRAISRRGRQHASAQSKARLQQADAAGDTGGRTPRPRFAHQFVFDAKRKVHYLFGGNPGLSTGTSANCDTPRLDDFWQLSIKMNTWQDLLRQCIWLIRKTHFLCLVHTDHKVSAVKYMQEELSALAQHIGCMDELHSLASHLFNAAPPPNLAVAQSADACELEAGESSEDSQFMCDATAECGDGDATLKIRRSLFAKLVQCFNRKCRPPERDLRTIMASYL